MDKEELQNKLIRLTQRQCQLEHYLETYMEPYRKELKAVNDEIWNVKHKLEEYEERGTDRT